MARNRGVSILTDFTAGANHPITNSSTPQRQEESLLVQMKSIGVQIQRACAEEVRAQSRHMMKDMKRELRALMQEAVRSQLFIPRHTPFPDDVRHETDLQDSSEGRVTCAPPEPPPTLPAGVGPPSGSSLRRPRMRLFSSARRECDDAFMPPPVPGVAEVPPPVLPFEVPNPPESPTVQNTQAINLRNKAQSCKPWMVHDSALLQGRALEGQADAAAGSARSELELIQDLDESSHSELEENERELKPLSLLEESMGELARVTERTGSFLKASVVNRSTGGKARTTVVRRLSLGMHREKKMTRSKTKPFYQMTAAELLTSSKFDNTMGFLILLNAATIGWQADYAARHVTGIFPEYFSTVERIFCALFTVELLLRIYVQRQHFWWGPKKTLIWNYFDLLVVTAQLLEEVITIAASSNGIDLAKFRLLRVLRILRLVRILRVVRVLHLISELRTIISSILGSVKSLAWTVVLLSLIIYIVGVYFTNQITDYLVEKALASEEKTKGDNELSYYFGSLGRALLSLWQAMSGGADWDSMAGPLIDVHPLLGVAFALFIAFALLALMNVVTGVFVQTALQNAKEEEDLFLSDQIVKLFEIRDREKKTRITLEEIEARLANPATAMDWKAINVSASEAKYLFELLDIEESGEIGFEEFLGGCLRLHGTAKSFDLLTVMQEHRAMAKTWNTHSQELQDELGDLRQQVLMTAHLTSVCSSCMENVVDMLRSSQNQILRMELQMQGQESALSMTKQLKISVDNLQSFLNTVAGLPAVGVPQRPNPKGWPQVSHPISVGAANAPSAKATALKRCVPPNAVESDEEV